MFPRHGPGRSELPGWGWARPGEGVLPLTSGNAHPLPQPFIENVKAKGLSIIVEKKLTHAVGSPLTAQGAYLHPPPFLIHFPPYNIYIPKGR